MLTLRESIRVAKYLQIAHGRVLLKNKLYPNAK